MLFLAGNSDVPHTAHSPLCFVIPRHAPHATVRLERNAYSFAINTEYPTLYTRLTDRGCLRACESVCERQRRRERERERAKKIQLTVNLEMMGSEMMFSPRGPSTPKRRRTAQPIYTPSAGAVGSASKPKPGARFSTPVRKKKVTESSPSALLAGMGSNLFPGACADERHSVDTAV